MILPSARLGCCLPVREVDPASMTSIDQQEGRGRGLAGWVTQCDAGRRRRRSTEGDSRPTLRFALYGRTSTVDYQDRCSSRGWQREVAESVIAGRGWIVEEFFEVGCSRRLPWSRRPRAAALLAAAEAGECRFDAVVVSRRTPSGGRGRTATGSDPLAGVARRCAGHRTSDHPAVPDDSGGTAALRHRSLCPRGTRTRSRGNSAPFRGFMWWTVAST